MKDISKESEHEKLITDKISSELRRKSSNKFMVNFFDNIFWSLNADAVLKRFFNLFRKTNQ